MWRHPRLIAPHFAQFARARALSCRAATPRLRLPGLNTSLAMLGAAPPVFRLPYSPYGPELRAEGARILTELGLEHCVRGPAGGPPGLLPLTDADWTLLEQY
jgi:hypothetical protein